jgi:pyridoxine 5-phosphate synthase
MQTAPRLSVNINKVALLRNSRGGNNPDVMQVAHDCVRFGAQGITVHPRPDARHIRTDDVYALKQGLSVEFNIEGYPSADFVRMVREVQPAQVTLVPDAPGALTSSEGWDTNKHAALLREVLAQFAEAGIRTSLFMECKPELIRKAKELGADRVELYTGPYAHDFAADKAAAVAPYAHAAQEAAAAGLGLNAGHDLSLHNLAYFKQQVPTLLEVSIGHALICDALYLGLEKTIAAYLACLR